MFPISLKDQSRERTASNGGREAAGESPTACRGSTEAGGARAANSGATEAGGGRERCTAAEDKKRGQGERGCKVTFRCPDACAKNVDEVCDY